jgi:hypothetical protein
VACTAANAATVCTGDQACVSGICTACTEQWPEYRSVIDVWKGLAFTSSNPARSRPEHTSTRVFLRKRVRKATPNAMRTACDGTPTTVTAPMTVGDHSSNNHGRNPTPAAGTPGMTADGLVLCWSLYSDGGSFSGTDATVFQDGGTWDQRSPRGMAGADGRGNSTAEKKYRAVADGKQDPNSGTEAGPGGGAIMPCDCDPQNAFLGPTWAALWYTLPFANAGAHWCNNDAVRQYESFKDASCSVVGLLSWSSDCLRPYFQGPTAPNGGQCPTLGFIAPTHEDHGTEIGGGGTTGWPEGEAARQARVNYSAQCALDFMGPEQELDSFDDLMSDPPMGGVSATEMAGLHDASRDPASCGPLGTGS